MRTIFIVTLLATPALAGPFQVISTQESNAGNLRRTTTIVQNGANPLDRFAVERVVKRGSEHRHHKGAIILTPPLGAPGAFYDVGDAPGGADFENSISANLARGGLDVYVYTPRAGLLAPGACNSADCSVMAGWGMQARLDDLAYIRGLSRGKPIIAGFSEGGMTALAAVNQDPQAYAGLVDLDGILLTDDVALSFSYSLVCGGLHGLIASGQVFNDQQNEGLQALLQLSLLAPDAPSPVPGLPPGTTNRQAYLFALTTPSAGPPASIFPLGFTTSAGSVPENRLFFASEARVASEIFSFSAYIPNLELADPACALAGDPTFTSNLSSFKRPALGFEQGAGFGALIHASLNALGGAVETVTLPGYGHLDLVSSPSHKQLFEDRILRWIDDAHVFCD